MQPSFSQNQWWKSKNKSKGAGNNTMNKLKEDDLALCTVKSVEGTTVFVDVQGGEKGSIVFSEIAAGRIRNIREYVSPNKKIVCKVLRVYPDHLELSFRRVTGKERESVLEENKKEKTFSGMLKTISSDYQKIIDNIKSFYLISEFIEEIKTDSKLIEKYFSKKEAELLSKILSEKKEKEKVVKKVFILKSFTSSGLSDIKEILNIKDAKISYLGSSQFSISKSGKNLKDAEREIQSLLEQIGKKAKEKKAIFEYKEK